MRRAESDGRYQATVRDPPPVILTRFLIAVDSTAFAQFPQTRCQPAVGHTGKHSTSSASTAVGPRPFSIIRPASTGCGTLPIAKLPTCFSSPFFCLWQSRAEAEKARSFAHRKQSPKNLPNLAVSSSSSLPLLQERNHPPFSSPIPMSCFLRAAGRAVDWVVGLPHDPLPYSGLYLASSLQPAAGHLGLVRARPGLADLHVRPMCGAKTRFHRDATAKEISEAEAKGDTLSVEVGRILTALVDLEDGRFEDALDALSRLAAESHGAVPSVARLCAAAACYQLGRVEEGDQWLASIPEDIDDLPRPCESYFFQRAVVAATLGGASAAVADSEGRVASAAFRVVNEKLWESVLEGDMSVAKKLLVTGLLKRASQALLCAVVLRAQPLSGERVRAALGAAERELARAIEEGDAPAVADLRLLVALLTAREGRLDEALERYAEVARDNPSDPRPHYLACHLSLFVGSGEEFNKWLASYQRLDQGSLSSRVELKALSDELLVAQALGGSPLAFREDCPIASRHIMGAAASRVDAALATALRGKKMTMVKRLEVRAVRAFLHAQVSSAIKDFRRKEGSTSTATN
ncbi:hypothetical protein EJB05_15761 [Eragrostis curvula]|uniref:Uncharacterized protein n=1 Tax=Eragrostis curvula TaxID=38414 RepID=A0A5J9VDC3_9POAL|nr:hypothetical protein EJB05_15761 [Eragrostis curvula]